MLDNINQNKLLFLDIETCGSYATIEELEDKDTTLFNLWNKMGGGDCEASQGSASRFFYCAKASKSERNMGMKVKGTGSNTYNKKCVKCGKWQLKQGFTDDYTCKCDNPDWETPTGNVHPTVKPISLMSYLVTLGSREGDVVLDPFVGSGTTCIAAKILNRKYLGMEMDDGYVVIAQERIKAHKSEKMEHSFF